MAGLHPLLLLMSAAVLGSASSEPLLPPAAPNDGAVIRLVQNAPKVVVLRENKVGRERIATGSGERLQVLFADGSTISLAPNSEVAIESFVFDPATGSARLAATLTRGVFRFIGGRTSKTPDGVTLSTPFGTIVVDRAVADLSLGGDGGPPHFDLVSGGAITLMREGSVVSRVRQPGYSIAPADGGGSGATVRKTPPEWRNFVLERLS